MDQAAPLSNYDSPDPKDLWKRMAAYEEKTGGHLPALAHNVNLSNELMFEEVTLTDKRPRDLGYAERRMRRHPLYEVTQIKGEGKTHPFLSPNDEFAQYGNWDKGSFGAVRNCFRLSMHEKR